MLRVASAAAAGCRASAAIAATSAVAAATARTTVAVVMRRAAAASTARAASTFYTKDHEYAKVEGAAATCGVSHYAQTQLGDIVFVSLPAVGDKFAKGATMCSIESVKAANDVYAPVSGTVTAVNKTLAENPSLVNESPEDKGWIVKLGAWGQREPGSRRRWWRRVSGRQRV